MMRLRDLMMNRGMMGLVGRPKPQMGRHGMVGHGHRGMMGRPRGLMPRHCVMNWQAMIFSQHELPMEHV